MDEDKNISNEIRIVFFAGRNSFHPISLALIRSFDLSLVVTTDSKILESVKILKTPYTRVLSIDEKLINEIKKLEPEVGVVADFGLIIPPELIAIFPHGIINIHPSLLPKYRGPTPVQSALLNGDTKTGFTIIKIDEKLDHGPILFQEQVIINPDENTPSLLKNLFERSAEILPPLIDSHLENETILEIQDESKATYTKQLTKQDGFIDIENPPSSEKLNRMINALAIWPGVWTKYNLTEKEVIIKLHPGEIIHVEGKKPMNYKDFKNGYEKGEEFLKKLALI